MKRIILSFLYFFLISISYADSSDHFNWKDRSTSICNAIKSRGLDPADFACLDNTSKVGTNFSWRGYARMICSRLGTTMDPGLPEVCGCPPIEWAGWRQ
jgi:hypothetical protein